MNSAWVMVIAAALASQAESWPSLPHLPTLRSTTSSNHSDAPCTCGIFLTGQLKNGAIKDEDENAALLLENEVAMHPCGYLGSKLCVDKCIDLMVTHLAKSGPMICGSIDRDAFKERAYLFVQNCDDTWKNSHFSAGREFCCKDGEVYKCPRGKRAGKNAATTITN